MTIHTARWPAICWIAAPAMHTYPPTVSAADPREVKLARPTPEQAAWQDMELGLFIHYDLPVVKPGWNHREHEKRPEASLFHPRKLDTDQWMEAAKAMGAKYAVLVAEHGTGFMTWQSDLYPFAFSPRFRRASP